MPDRGRAGAPRRGPPGAGRVVWFASWWTTAAGVLALLGWWLEPSLLAAPRRGETPLFPLAAVGLVCLGASLGLLAPLDLGRLRRRTGQLLALAVMLLGAVILVQYLAGWASGVDLLLFRDAVTATGGTFPGRPPPNTATAFVAGGLALTALDARSAAVQRWASVFACVAAGIALSALLSYLYDADYSLGRAEPRGMAVQLAVTMLVFATGALVARPDQSFAGPFLSSGPGGILARHLVPILLALPFVVGVLTFVASRLGYQDASMASTVAIVTSLFVMFLVIGRTARALDGADAAQRRTTVAVQGERDRLAALWESLHDGAAVLDMTGRILEVNRRWCEITGVDPPAAIGLRPPYPWQSSNQDVDAMMRACSTMAAGSTPVSEDDETVRRPDGSEVPVLITLVPVLGVDQRPHTFMLSYRDITERRNYEERLEQHNQALQQALRTKDNFLASMSHELRTPLNSILGFTGTLLMRLPGELTEEQERQLQTVQHSGKHLLSLINDILDLAKIESGVDIQLQPVDAQQVVGEVAQALAPLAAAKGLEFRLDLPGPPVAVLADHRGLEQILLNLVSNAIKFTDAGSVTVRLHRSGPPDAAEVAISVADTGQGIPASELSRIFDSFERAATTARRNQEGTGLGLTISRGLAELLDSRITVASTVGEGSTFTLHLKGAQTWELVCS